MHIDDKEDPRAFVYLVDDYEILACGGVWESRGRVSWKQVLELLRQAPVNSYLRNPLSVHAASVFLGYPIEPVSLELIIPPEAEKKERAIVFLPNPTSRLLREKIPTTPGQLRNEIEFDFLWRLK